MKKNTFSKLLATSAILSSAMFSASAFAVGTEAGTSINNTATVSFTNGETKTASVDFNVDEIINIINTGLPNNIVTNAGDTEAVINSYTIANLGNAEESITLAVSHTGSSAFIPTSGKIHYQRSTATENTDKFDPSDTTYTAGEEITLSKDEVLTVYVTYDIPSDAIKDQTAIINLIASSTTTGASAANLGDVLSDQGTKGSNGEAIDAIVIQGKAEATATFIIDLDANSLNVSIEKVIVGGVASGELTDSNNNSTTTSAFIPGAEVTYLIVVTVKNGTATDLTISDEIPLNMTYKGSSVMMKSEVGGVIDIATADFSTFTRPATGQLSEPTDKDTGTVSVEFGDTADGDYAIVLTAIIDK
tara:strand:+ start:148 stop:1230 length:1083 start_codon:yes stop_codon:yes gene_type:complete